MKIVVGVVAAIVAFVLVLLLLFGGAVSEDANPKPDECPTDGSSATAASYTGDLGEIRMPFTGTASYTSAYGMRFNPGRLEKGIYKLHAGADIAQTPSPSTIVSATKGKVQRVWTSGNGTNIVTVSVGGNTSLQYLHLASFAPGLKAGDDVWPGRVLGIEGETGNASGPHLHFEVIVGGKPVEPWAWMKQHGLKSAPAPGAVGTTLTGGPAVLTKPSGPTAQTVADSPSSSSETSDSGRTIKLPTGTGPGMEFRTNPPLSIPSDMLGYYRAAGDKYRIPWQLLAGIGMAETGHGRNPNDSYVGATGPMQFMPATFAAYGVDGNGDGKTDSSNRADAVFSAANYLAKTGATKPESIRDAIWHYNHSEEYINSVLSYAKHYAGGKVEVAASSGLDAARACDVSAGGAAAVEASGTYEKAAVEAARSLIGDTYVWGGGNEHGPTGGGFDCSGLTLYVVAQATKRAGQQLVLPHQSDQQKEAPTMATVAEYSGTGTPDLSKLRPGDILIYNLASGADRHPWNHTAVYVGNGRIIHAVTEGKPVAESGIADPGKGAWVARRPTTTYTGTQKNATAAASTPAAAS